MQKYGDLNEVDGVKKVSHEMTSLKSQGGFTLLEIIVAVAILSFGILAVASMQLTSIKGNSQAIGITEAITLAQDRAEKLMRLAYNDATLSDTDANGTTGLGDTSAPDQQDPANPIQVGGAGAQGREYNVYWNVVEDSPIDNTKTIRIIITWTDRGNQRNATLEIMKADII